MIKGIKILAAFLSVAMIVASWGMYTTVSARLANEQERLLTVAREYVNKKIYDKGVANFLDALNIKTGENASILYELANVYKNAQAMPKYRETLQELINNASVPQGMELSEIYSEAAAYDFGNDSSVSDTLKLLKDGIMKTGALDLVNLYQQNRYALDARTNYYDEAGVINGGAGLVSQGGLWGYVNPKGNNLIKPAYELATNFRGYGIVQKGGEIYEISNAGTRRATADFAAVEMTRFDGGAFSVKQNGSDKYVMATVTENAVVKDKIDITLGKNEFDYIGLPSDGITALRKDGKWGLHDRSDREEKLPLEYKYDGVAIDELGRCAINGAVFIKGGGKFYMMNYLGQKIGGEFDDAKPFFELNGLAAVKSGEKWGFVNAKGDVVVDYRYDNAGSSSGGLAPVCDGALWGYISVEDKYLGEYAIKPQYEGAKQFVNGCAPIKGADGWYYVMLVEYE